MVCTCKYKTPQGFDDMWMISDGEMLTGLWFEGSRGLLERRLDCPERDVPVFRETRRWLDIYFSGRQPDFTPSYRMDGLTPFRREVVEAMLAIPFGETATYGDIAAALAKRHGIAKMSAQAVGGAVGWNPICIIVPCHRVVGANRSLVGYGGGIMNKAGLLALETNHEPRTTNHEPRNCGIMSAMKTIETSMKALLAVAAALSACAAEAKVATATPFADNMVLQRGRAIPVWGTADAGEAVTVTFAGQTKSATADAKGAWRVMLDPLPASKENRILKVAGSANVEEIKNVLVGEVWFASGQSNMECPIWGPSPRYRDGQGAVMTASACRPFIRYAKNGRVWKVEPRYDWKAVWRDFSPASFKETFGYNLSAVAFYYALELYDALDVPVGIVDSSWGGTCIETWTPPCSFQTPPEVSATAKRAHQQPTALWNGMVAAWAPFAIKGFIWYQGCSNAGQGRRYSERMHALYDGWAKEFQNPDLKLYFVQLAPYSCSWFEVQQGQAIFEREEKNAGMAVTCDVGNSWDIHPNDKETVARRLALHALKRDYGFDGIIDNSPTLKGWKIEGDTFKMSFNDATAWYVYNADRSGVQGFEIAGPEGAFKPAKVVNGSSGTLKGAELIVKADGITKPRRLRYLASKPWIGALYSFDSGLPLGPFEIDARNPADGRRDLPSKLGDALKVPELEGFRTVYVADIPSAGKFEAGNYSVDNAAKAGAFSRVAYVMELVCKDDSVDWAVASMDAFTADAAQLGVPAVTKAFFQQKVGNLIVRSNRECVKEGPQEGVIEFFNANYAQAAKLAGIGGDGKRYDFNDAAGGPNPGYGCLQIHDWKNGTTIMAYNNFNGNGTADIGIGNSVEGPNPDWTFARNAGDYKARRLTILVK